MIYQEIYPLSFAYRGNIRTLFSKNEYRKHSLQFLLKPGFLLVQKDRMQQRDGQYQA